MSRSNPTDHSPNPSTRWFEWDGENGQIRYYDKEKNNGADKPKGGNVIIGDKFKFILLDSLSVVKGWHDPSGSGITSNEVRDTKAERLVVRAFKGGNLAEGFYASIRDRIKAVGGSYVCSLYIAFKGAAGLQIGNLQIHGAALNSFVEFEKANREALWQKAVMINGFTEDKKGKIVFRMPRFFITELTPESDAEAKKLDQQLQVYLKAYFARSRSEQVARPAEPTSESVIADEDVPVNHPVESEPEPETSDDVPF